MADIYEGAYWQVEVTYSNRYGTNIAFTGGGSDKAFHVPQSRVESTLQRLEDGEDPDIIAQSFPIDEPLKK